MIAKTVPFRTPRQGARLTTESYSLPKLVEELETKFSMCQRSITITRGYV